MKQLKGDAVTSLLQHHGYLMNRWIWLLGTAQFVEAGSYWTVISMQLPSFLLASAASPTS